MKVSLKMVAIEILFCSIDADSSCSFTKQDFIFKQAHHVSFCFGMCSKTKVLTVSSCFQSFLQVLSGNNL